MKVFDSSPLIAILGNLASPELLACFITMGYSLYVPNKVVEEISNHPEKQNLQRMLNKKEMIMLKPLPEEDIQKFRDRHPRLGKGESELILLAQEWKKENKKFCCIIDDAVARKTAEKLGLKCNGTIGLLHKLNGGGLIDKGKLNHCFRKLEECGFRYNFKNNENN
jgi:predicted nucleic acid-binding protein